LRRKQKFLHAHISSFHFARPFSFLFLLPAASPFWLLPADGCGANGPIHSLLFPSYFLCVFLAWWLGQVGTGQRGEAMSQPVDPNSSCKKVGKAVKKGEIGGKLREFFDLFLCGNKKREMDWKWAKLAMSEK
jgi:hypothetical protein